jgi:hypothetical protein
MMVVAVRRSAVLLVIRMDRMEDVAGEHLYAMIFTRRC